MALRSLCRGLNGFTSLGLGYNQLGTFVKESVCERWVACFNGPCQVSLLLDESFFTSQHCQMKPLFMWPLKIVKEFLILLDTQFE